MLSPIVQKLIDLFSDFPTVGPRTATRFVFYLIKQPKEEFDNLIRAMEDLRNTIKLCSSCFNPFDATDSDLCDICRDNARDKTTLCVVEKENDLISIENTKKYKGLYFILGGTVSALRKSNIRDNELFERIKNNGFQEIIIATNPTSEGEATALFLQRKIKELGVKTTRLGLGLPKGGELEYADEETLTSAFEGRK